MRYQFVAFPKNYCCDFISISGNSPSLMNIWNKVHAINDNEMKQHQVGFNWILMTFFSPFYSTHEREHFRTHPMTIEKIATNKSCNRLYWLLHLFIRTELRLIPRENPTKKKWFSWCLYSLANACNGWKRTCVLTLKKQVFFDVEVVKKNTFIYISSRLSKKYVLSPKFLHLSIYVYVSAFFFLHAKFLYKAHIWSYAFSFLRCISNLNIS